MAITKSAKKAIRQAARRRIFNLRRQAAFKKTVKEFKALIAVQKTEEAKKFFPKVMKALDKAAKRGVLKPGTVNRRKSRLSRLFRVGSSED